MLLFLFLSFLCLLNSMVFGSGSVRRHNDAADAVQMNVNVASINGDRETKKKQRTHTYNGSCAGTIDSTYPFICETK